MEQLINKFLNIFEVAIISDKSKELQAIESLTIEADALTIIRLCEELLTITRGLKETWCLGTLKVKQGNVSEDVDDGEDLKLAHEKFNELTAKIAQFEQTA